ncbi:MAG: RNA polymerase sigma factor [Opitutae bacterium]|nr:RNA polymerase sigma factor [Opitutae bacterium]
MPPPSDETDEKRLLARARAGGRTAFGALVTRHDAALRAYLHRLTAHRADADDLAQETWLRVQRRLKAFDGRAAFRTWLFAIATNLARDHWRARRRWREDAQDQARALAESTPGAPEGLRQVAAGSPRGRYELREHVGFCFTCVMKTLPLAQHVALLLVEVHGFKDREAADVMGVSLARLKHLLHAARATMNRVFAQRCALVGKTGACHQCSELNGFFNGDQSREQARVAALQRALTRGGEERLLRLRAALVREVDPLQGPGADLQDAIMRLVHRAVARRRG